MRHPRKLAACLASLMLAGSTVACGKSEDFGDVFLRVWFSDATKSGDCQSGGPGGTSTSTSSIHQAITFVVYAAGDTHFLDGNGAVLEGTKDGDAYAFSGASSYTHTQNGGPTTSSAGAQTSVAASVGSGGGEPGAGGAGAGSATTLSNAELTSVSFTLDGDHVKDGTQKVDRSASCSGPQCQLIGLSAAKTCTTITPFTGTRVHDVKLDYAIGGGSGAKKVSVGDGY